MPIQKEIKSYEKKSGENNNFDNSLIAQDLCLTHYQIWFISLLRNLISIDLMIVSTNF